MSKKAGIGSEAATGRYKPPKRTKSQRTKPSGKKPPKPYRGQGRA